MHLAPSSRDKLFGRLFILCVIMSAMLTGCGKNTNHSADYSKLRPSTELAALSLQQDLMLIDFDRIPLPEISKTYNIAPGDYEFQLIYYDTGAMNPEVRITTGKLTTLTINMLPGKLYYVYPSFTSADQWQPQVYEFIRPDDLSAYSDDFWSDLEKGTNIEKTLKKHFQKNQP